jgi:dTDP-glucose pyrophosphorylase
MKAVILAGGLGTRISDEANKQNKSRTVDTSMQTQSQRTEGDGVNVQRS